MCILNQNILVFMVILSKNLVCILKKKEEYQTSNSIFRYFLKIKCLKVDNTNFDKLIKNMIKNNLLAFNNFL